MSNASKYGLFLVFCLLSATRDSISEVLFKGVQLSPVFLLFVFSVITQAVAFVTILLLPNERKGVVRAINAGAFLETIALNFFTLSAFLLYFLAIASPVGAATNSLIDYGTAPLFTGIVGGILLNQNISRDFFISSAICISGIIIAYPIFLNDVFADPKGIQQLSGFFFAIGSSFCSAIYRVYFKVLLNKGASKSWIVFSRLLGVSIVLGMYIVFFPSLWRPDMFIEVSVVGFFSFTAPLFISLFVLQKISIESFSILLFCLPLVTAIESMWLGYYEFSWPKILGGTILLCGIWLFERSKKTIIS